MQIQSFVLAAEVSSTQVAKLQPSSNTQNTVKLKSDVAHSEIDAPPRTASSMTINISGLTSPFQSQGGSSKGINQLSSMLETSLKMQSIRNDSSMPEQVKDKLLNTLEQVNEALLIIADAKAEEEEKSKMIEASNKDAESVRNAGEESANAINESPISAEPTKVTSNTDEMKDSSTTFTETAFQANSSRSSTTSQTSSSSYSTTQSVGGNVDITA